MPVASKELPGAEQKLPGQDKFLPALPRPKAGPHAVEKLQFPPKQPKFGGYKMSRKLRKSFVGHPSAMLFLRISREGVFQQTRLISSTIVEASGQDFPARAVAVQTVPGNLEARIATQ